MDECHESRYRLVQSSPPRPHPLLPHSPFLPLRAPLHSSIANPRPPQPIPTDIFKTAHLPDINKISKTTASPNPHPPYHQPNTAGNPPFPPQPPSLMHAYMKGPHHPHDSQPTRCYRAIFPWLRHLLLAA
ncbi:hypothetical protein IMZ48_33880 [Candidatus Bathyarchaeota archaeon]|nr:hypothetical protein [Candidatus Bathyarchaeota archaeon]